MNDTQVLELVSGAMMMISKLAGPLLVSALVIGVLVSLLQTVTQIQEMTLSFVPKLVGMGAILLFGGNWMLSELTTWTRGLWSMLPKLVG